MFQHRFTAGLLCNRITQLPIEVFQHGSLEQEFLNFRAGALQDGLHEKFAQVDVCSTEGVDELALVFLLAQRQGGEC